MMSKKDSMKRCLVGDMLPIKEMSVGGAAEKQRSTGRINNLHRWWAAKPTSVSRIITFSSLVDPPLDNHLDSILKMCDYASSTIDKGSIKIRDEIRKVLQEEWKTRTGNDEPPRVLDPFGGTGALPFAAGWLGCESHCTEYNPVALVLEKCALEYPAKHGDKLLKDVKKIADEIEIEIKKSVSEFYPSGGFHLYRWCRTLPCSSCGAIMPLVRSFELSKKKNISLKAKISNKTITFVTSNSKKVLEPTIGNKTGKCLSCGYIHTNIEMRKALMSGLGDEQQLVSIFTKLKNKGKFYHAITAEDIKLYEKCSKELEKRRDKFIEEYGIDPVPNDIINTPNGKEYKEGGSHWDALSVVTHGYTRWNQLFNDRQMLCLVSILDILRKTESNILEKHGDEYGTALMTYMALIFDKTVEKYCKLSLWDVASNKSRHCFSQQKLSNMWDYPEENILTVWENSARSVLTGITPALCAAKDTKYVCTKASATNLPYENEYFDAVCTDPPYYDSMQYSKTADFFYVWMKKTLGHLELYKNLFKNSSSPKKLEIIETKKRSSGFIGTSDIVRDKHGYQKLMTDAIKEMYRVLKPDGVLTLVYAHKTTEGWETLIQAMIDSGFVIMAAWPIDTETKVKMAAHNVAALEASIYMVGQKYEKQPICHYNDLKHELKEHVCARLEKFKNNGITGADFHISAIGASIEIYSKYESVLHVETGKKVTVKEILNEIRKLCSEYIVKILTTDNTGDIDDIAKLYISWRWSYGDRPVEFAEANKMFNGIGINIENYLGDLIIKNGKLITLQDSEMRGNIKNPSGIIDVLHQSLHLLRRENNKPGMQKLLRESGYAGDSTFTSVCQAIVDGGAKSNSHTETKESREISSFLTVQKINVDYRPSPESPQTTLD